MIPMSRVSAQSMRGCKTSSLTCTGRAFQLSCSLCMPLKLSPLRSIAFLMEDPTRSRAHPPSRVATTAVTMVTPPKVKSMDSRPTPNSSCPACVHARRMACEFPSSQQASRLWYQKHLTNEHAEHLAKGTNYNVPLVGVAQQLLAKQSQLVRVRDSMTAALRQTLVSCCLPYTCCVKTQSTHSQEVYT